MASIQKRVGSTGKVYYRAQIRKKGFDDITASFDNEDEAREWARITESSLSDRTTFYTVNEIFDRYELEVLSKKSKAQQSDEKIHLLFWRSHLGKRKCSDILPIEIESIANTLYQTVSKKTGNFLTPETRRKHLMTLSFIFNVCCLQWKIMQSNPVYLVDKHEGLIKKQKTDNKEKDKTDIQKNKKEFIEGIKNRIKELSLQSIGELCRYLKMPKETIRKILDESQNTSLSMMVEVADKLGLSFSIMWND